MFKLFVWSSEDSFRFHVCFTWHKCLFFQRNLDARRTQKYDESFYLAIMRFVLLLNYLICLIIRSFSCCMLFGSCENFVSFRVHCATHVGSNCTTQYGTMKYSQFPSFLCFLQSQSSKFLSLLPGKRLWKFPSRI